LIQVFFQDRGVEFEFNLGQQNMQKKVNKMELWLKNDDVILQNMKNIKNHTTQFNVKPSRLPQKKKFDQKVY
jgi:hypothetical protein